MAELKVSDLTKTGKEWRFELIVSKIADGKPFDMENGDNIKLKFINKATEIIFKKKDKDGLKELTGSREPLFKSGTENFKLGDLFKSPEFGGGGGSGGGAQKTEMTESLQCYYMSLLYNSNRRSLTVDNCTVKDLSSKDNIQYCDTPTYKTQKAVRDLISDPKIEDWTSLGTNGKELNVFMKTANVIYNSQEGKGWAKPVYFHRGSPFMDAIYAARKVAFDWDKQQEHKKAPASFSNDKWNPGDIWMSTLNPDPKSSKVLDFGVARKNNCVLTFDLLKQKVWELAQEKKLLGISLKKVGATPKVSAYNIGATAKTRKQNTDVGFDKFSFGSNPKGSADDFFSSADLYIKFTNNKLMQLRSTDGTKSWQGEVKGATAAAGKIGGGGVNYYCQEFFKKAIGHSGEVDKWSEIRNVDKRKMYDLYVKYSNHSKNNKKVKTTITFKQFQELADGYVNPKGRNAAPSFYFSKYMCLLFLDTIKWADTVAVKGFSTQILRYAMSNVDMSSYFVKVE